MKPWTIFVASALAVAVAWTAWMCCGEPPWLGPEAVAEVDARTPQPPTRPVEMPAPPARPERPNVEVVFVLDTTGSMGDLIQAAKEKIWSIANTLVSARPTPRIKMGLVAYRDRGDAYVTKRTDLTTDLDGVYRELMDYKADGGGDTPESVNQALSEAVTLMQWSKDPKTYRVIFLVGDCPPKMNYPDDVKYPVTCEAAARAGIIVNTIQCGKHGATIPIWQQIALKAEGRYFRVEQSGSAILASTPFDADLAKLGKELNGTRFFYGTKEERRRLEKNLTVADEIDSGASTAAKARRADFLAKPAGEATLSGWQELVGDVARDAVDLDDLKTDRLPEVMQKMSPEDREKFVKENIAKRKRIQAQINELAARRQTHIKEQIKKRADKGTTSLSGRLYEAVKDQAGKKGIAYTDGPSH